MFRPVDPVLELGVVPMDAGLGALVGAARLVDRFLDWNASGVA